MGFETENLREQNLGQGGFLLLTAAASRRSGGSAANQPAGGFEATLPAFPAHAHELPCPSRYRRLYFSGWQQPAK